MISRRALQSLRTSRLKGRLLFHGYSLAIARSHCTQPEEYGYTRRRSDYWPEEDLQTLAPALRPDRAETLDLILRQKVYLLQSRRGYRATTDSHVLAFFSSANLPHSLRQEHSGRPLRVLELGAGVGLVSILFALANSPCHLDLVELQGPLANRARRNLELNNLHGHVTQHDLESGCLPRGLDRGFDVVLINPPFYTICGSRGPPPRLRERLLAHMETSAGLPEFITAARSALDPANPNAHVSIIHHRAELPRVLKAMDEVGMRITILQEMIHRDQEEASRVLVQAVPELQGTIKNGEGGLQWSAPLCLHPGPKPNLKMYCKDIEDFLDSIPTPRLRIGRLRD